MKNSVITILLIFLLGACSPISTPSILPTETAILPTSTATPTVIWFPPTATLTPFPTRGVTPTVDMLPNIGQLIFEDDFSDASAWSLSHTDLGSVALGKNELTIAIGESAAYMFSVREQPILTDFYLEITASPTLCRDLDEYGLLLRVSPSLDYYRFSLSCNGQVRLDRLYGGQASSPQPWLMSGAVPPGAPSTSRLGVWAVGSEMRFFVNGGYQFSVNEPVLSSGGVGVFVRSTSDNAVTVNFSDLVVYEVTK
jgi:hypothetical protein